MNKKNGEIIGINGNMITVAFDGNIIQNEVGYAITGNEKLKSEVIKIQGNNAFMQVFESTKGLKVGDSVEFTGDMLSVQLGPGILGMVYDGLQNPLNELAQKYGFFLKRGISLDALDFIKKWGFVPTVKVEDTVTGGNSIGYVVEDIFKHYIFIPFHYKGEYVIKSIVPKGDYTVEETIALIKDKRGSEKELKMYFDWPVKIPIISYREKMVPHEPLITQTRIIDTFFPVAKGGTYCIPGPFGAGKTVLQQVTSKYAEADIVIIAACGERAGEVVETLRTFPEIIDPRTGKFLMDRTIIICNTSSMPVAARDASVYTATTLGEYYRQMGLNVLLLADSTSRWAQAMRELSGRLEEIPGEEAFPAYLESRIAQFYERAGLVELNNRKIGSLTIGGTISPAGGNFEEPVTQSTLKVVGAFHGLSRDRSNARRYPAIHPLESWTKYNSFIPANLVNEAKSILFKGNEVHQMMLVVGEEGTSLDDFEIYLKSEFCDSVYLQQNSFDKVDGASSPERQKYVFKRVHEVLTKKFALKEKQEARRFFNKLRQLFIDWNYIDMKTDKFKVQEKLIMQLIEEYSGEVTESTEKVVGSFHDLAREVSSARIYPAVNHLERWSKSSDFAPGGLVDEVKSILFKGNEVHEIILDGGEEEIPIGDFVIYLKSEFFNSVSLKLSSIAKDDEVNSPERQKHIFTRVQEIITREFTLKEKQDATNFFDNLRQFFIDWINTKPDKFEDQEELITNFIKENSEDEESI